MTKAQESEPPLRLAYLIGRLDRMVRRDLEEALAEVDLTIAQYTAMSVLRRRPGLSNAQLARRSLVSPQAMNQALSGLVERRLIHRPAKPKGRVLAIELTAEGQAILDHLGPLINSAEDRLLAELRPTQRDSLLAMLETITDLRQH
ncbi:MAG: MarR family transcriptional regulator [Acidimicrobiia bacterium]|nr:MarR family transcriptional regulator [Acidimicrobiia bacterium]MDH5520821.1 MarR family transcriptional regulator [Acidimicrobiia bacterium]